MNESAIQALIAQWIGDARSELAGMDAGKQQDLLRAAALLIDCYKAGHTVYLCGNGGSAADAQHIAAELTGRFLRDRKPLACTALTTNTSTLTSVGNDYGYDEVFARQVRGHARPGDVVWLLSTSGTSRNIILAARAARDQGARILSFTGGTGGELAGLSDVCFIAPAKTSYGIQQLHQLGYHIVCNLVERQIEA